jgi:hypothetical protein
MENQNEKQAKEQTQEEKQQIQSEPAAENLSDAELDKVAGGSIHLNSSRSNVY